MDQEIPATLMHLCFDSLTRISDHAATKLVYDPRVIKDIDANSGELWCPDLAPEIFDNLRVLEHEKRRPLKSTKVDEKRGQYIDWFVNFVQLLGFSNETLYYAVNYFDSCTMGKMGDISGTSLLSLACFVLASKYEEEFSCPSIKQYSEKFFFSCQQITDMESRVWESLEYDMSSPTTWTFMERFIKAAHDGPGLRCMARYIAELSLYSYNVNIYLPSMVAASSVFLASYILDPSQIPWNPTLQHYTLYEPSNLRDCVKELHDIVVGRSYNYTGIRDKYSKFQYSRVALTPVPLSIPEEYFASICASPCILAGEFCG